MTLSRSQAGRLVVIVLGSFALGVLATRHLLVPVIGIGFILGQIFRSVER
jgi:hypothetical protein